MPAKLIDGKKIADEIKLRVRKEVVDANIAPGLAVFLIGDDEASHTYVKLKEKACKEIGIHFHKYLMGEKTPASEVADAIEFINRDEMIDAILLQLPLPEGFDDNALIAKIDPAKDVDGFHPQTLQNYLDGKSDFIPGLSLGIIRLIESTGETLRGKDALIIANSEIFAAPLRKLLEEQGMKVVTSSPDAADLAAAGQKADVLIVAVGRPGLITAEKIKTGAIIIDVGTTKVDGELLGDVDLESIADKAGHVTPVPGGVGPVTVAMLMENTVKLAKIHHKN
jgi:methylenetetrahydrofolate dehydrogenase (NADP+) / methenyltetrahydrofolate cyclohydrolase